MKTSIKICLFTLAVLLQPGILEARSHEEFTKTIRKEFQVNPDATLNLNSRYGKIHISTWDKNMITIEVTITVEASDQESANKKMDRITVAFSGSPSLVTAVTNLNEGGRSSKGKFSIDYVINMPLTNNLEIAHKFGDIFLSEINGKTRIDLGYGNLDARKLGNSDNLVDIEFSKARIDWMKGAVLTLKYSSMELEYAGSLRLNSKYSDLEAEKIIALNVLLEGGKLEMENSSAIISQSKFSDLKIRRIEQSLDLDIQYGSCDVGEMPAGFSFVNIRNKFGNVSIGLNEQSRFALDARMKFCNLDFRDEKARFSFRSVSPTETIYKGTVGGAEEPVSKVEVKSEFGNVSLR